MARPAAESTKRRGRRRTSPRDPGPISQGRRDARQGSRGKPGERLLDVAWAHGQPLEGACEGVMACSTCHVIVDAQDFARLPPASEEEEDLLDIAAHVTRTSRLACQILLTNELEIAERADAARRPQLDGALACQLAGEGRLTICAAEVGGRRCRQPGQIRKEAATTISFRVVGFHLFPALRTRQPLLNRRRGWAMTEFEFLFSVFGLLIGLTLIEIAIKFADAIDAHHRRPIGLLDSASRLVRSRRCRGLLAVQLVAARSPPCPLADGVHRAHRGDDLLFVGIDDLSPQRGPMEESR